MKDMQKYIDSKILPEDKKGSDYYIATPGSLYKAYEKQDGTEATILKANGCAIVNAIVDIDDGIESRKDVELQVFANGKDKGIYTFPIEKINNGKFIDNMPLEFRVKDNGSGIKDFIKWQAGKERFEHKKIYAHTGWINYHGENVFLHGGGAIGAENVKVNLDPRLSKYSMSMNKDEDRYLTFQRWFEILPRSAIYPLTAFIFLTPMLELFRQENNEPSFMLYFQCHTGLNKSTIGALALSFFGNFSRDSLPFSSKDSYFAIEKKAMVLNDVPILIDDMFPSDIKGEKQRIQILLQRVLRLFGDRGQSDRGTSSGDLRLTHPPMCNPIVTAEDKVEVGESGVARYFKITWEKENINLDAITEIQNNIPHLSQIMTDYIEWIIPRFEPLKKQIKEDFLKYRKDMQALGGHARVGENAAFLQVGFETMNKFLVDTELLSEPDADRINSECKKILLQLSIEQIKTVSSSNPAVQFIADFIVMERSGRITFRDVKRLGNIEGVDINKYGSRAFVGFKDEDYYYFYADSMYSNLLNYYRESGRDYPITKGKMLSLLNKEGIIKSFTNKNGKQSNTHNKRIPGMDKPQSLVWMPIDKISNATNEDN